jgi:hypothetical protein
VTVATSSVCSSSSAARSDSGAGPVGPPALLRLDTALSTLSGPLSAPPVRRVRRGADSCRVEDVRPLFLRDAPDFRLVPDLIPLRGVETFTGLLGSSG